MRLRWLKLTEATKAEHLNVPWLETYEGIFVLQAGHWEASSQFRNADGRPVPVMEERFHDIPMEEP